MGSVVASCRVQLAFRVEQFRDDNSRGTTPGSKTTYSLKAECEMDVSTHCDNARAKLN